jgi:flagellar assembly protein FliH
MARDSAIRLPGKLLTVETGPSRARSPGGETAETDASEARQAGHGPSPVALVETSELRRAIGALEQAARQLGKLQEQIYRDAEEQLLNLAIQIAQKVLGQEIKAGRHEVDSIVKEILSHVPSGQAVVVHLHPEDLSRCKMASQNQVAGEESLVEFVGDAGVERGQCLVETPGGTLKSSVEDRLEYVVDALRNHA